MFGGTYEKQSNSFEPLPKGRYNCILDNCCIEQTSNGTDFLKMDFTVVSGSFSNRKIWHKMWFSEKAYNMAAQQLDNMAVFEKIEKAETIKDFLTNSAKVVFDHVGGKFEVSVTGHDTYNEKTYEKTFITGLPEADTGLKNHAPQTASNVDQSEEIPF